MFRLRLSAAFAAVLSLAIVSPAFAASGARFGGTVYNDAPNLANTLSLVMAGGGPKHYSTVTLFGVLADGKAKAEEAALTKEFGAEQFGQFIKTFDFVISDSLAIVTKDKVMLPAKPEPNPSDGKALAAALYKDGLDPSGGFNVEFMLDHLVTHPIHVQVMKDIDAKWSPAVDAEYHVILTKVMQDLKAVYGL